MELINHSQERGITILKEHIDRRKSEGHKVYSEPTPRNQADEIVYAPDGLKLPLRYDLVFQDSNGDFHTDSADSTTLHFREPVFANWENQMKIEIHSICWNHLELQISPPFSQNNWEILRLWFLRWFDLQDEKAIDSNGLTGVVHFISDPITTGDRVHFVVDLGSATPDALADLFDQLIKCGVSECTLGKPSAEDIFTVRDN
jgi:hypothetical protein